jgi:intein-encoded DNA endonuclease-like protein
MKDAYIQEIRNNPDKVDWIHISIHQKLSEDFIREFQDKVNWNCISYNQKLSENFIREFQDEVYWYCISEKQKLSEDFIRDKIKLIGFIFHITKNSLKVL